MGWEAPFPTHPLPKPLDSGTMQLLAHLCHGQRWGGGGMEPPSATSAGILREAGLSVLCWGLYFLPHTEPPGMAARKLPVSSS